jgi:hypothetical protein
VQAWVCGYRAESSAFDAMQRAKSAPDVVRFQEGKYLVVVHWSGGSREENTALVRAIQKALPRR